MSNQKTTPLHLYLRRLIKVVWWNVLVTFVVIAIPILSLSATLVVFEPARAMIAIGTLLQLIGFLIVIAGIIRLRDHFGMAGPWTSIKQWFRKAHEQAKTTVHHMTPVGVVAGKPSVGSPAMSQRAPKDSSVERRLELLEGSLASLQSRFSKLKIQQDGLEQKVRIDLASMRNEINRRLNNVEDKQKSALVDDLPLEVAGVYFFMAGIAMTGVGSLM